MDRIISKQVLAWCVGVSALVSSVAFGQTTSFTASYKGQGAGSSSCNTSFTITGEEPTASGKYPVFLYMVGTTETATNASATAAVQDMANLGYVAATIGYDTGDFTGCSSIGGKAM